LRAGIADQLDTRGKIIEVFGVAHVTVEEGDAVMGKNGQVTFAAAPDQIVHDGDFVPRFPKMKRDMRTDEAATAGYEYVQ
jgi:hypothetical protein